MPCLVLGLMLPLKAAEPLEILGKVTLNTRDGVPQPGVKVVDDKGAASNTGKDGQFKMTVEKPAAGWVKLRLAREGQAAVNVLDLRQPVPKGAKLRFTAAIAPVQEVRDRADHYWTQELLGLRKTRGNLTDSGDSESEEALIRRYAEWLAALNPEALSEVWFQIFHDWTGGHFERARKGLDGIDFTTVKSADEALRLHHLSAAVAFTQNDIKAAVKAAEAAAATSPEDAFALLMQARLYNRSGELLKAGEVAERLLAKADAGPEVHAQVAHILALSAFKAGDMKLAIRHLGKTVEFYDQAATAGMTFAEERRIAQAKVTFALGIWQISQDSEKAQQSMASGLALHRKLAQKYPELNGEALGDALDGAANLQGVLRNLTEAITLLKEEADLYQKLAKGKPGLYLPLLARTLGRLGQFSLLQRMPDEALSRYEEALKVVMGLSQPSREEGHLPLVCSLFRGQGEALTKLSRFPDAEASFKQAVAFHQELRRISPGKLEHLAEQAVIWQKLAELYLAQGQSFAAAQSFASAGQICTLLVERGVESQRSAAFMCYKNVAAINHQAKQHQDALKYALLAVGHSEKIEAQSPVQHEALAEVELLTALLLGKEKKMEDGRSHALIAVRLYRGLAKKDSAAFSIRLGQALVTLSELGAKEDAEPLLQEAQKLLESHPDGPEASLLRESLRLLNSGKRSIEL